MVSGSVIAGPELREGPDDERSSPPFAPERAFTRATKSAYVLRGGVAPGAGRPSRWELEAGAECIPRYCCASVGIRGTAAVPLLLAGPSPPKSRPVSMPCRGSPVFFCQSGLFTFGIVGFGGDPDDEYPLVLFPFHGLGADGDGTGAGNPEPWRKFPDGSGLGMDPNAAPVCEGTGIALKGLFVPKFGFTWGPGRGGPGRIPVGPLPLAGNPFAGWPGTAPVCEAGEVEP